MKKYYEAYDERYKKIHRLGHQWSSYKETPIILETIEKYQIQKESKILEIGCGEGRDSIFLLNKGFNILATDISLEAINYCKEKFPSYSNNFQQLDCLNGIDKNSYDFIYAVAVLHMLVKDEDRNSFYKFIYNHLNIGGCALILSMGNGTYEMQSNIEDAFIESERNHESGKVKVASTSCRMVNLENFEKEIINNGFTILEKGFTSSLPDFDSLLYAVIKRKQ